jgi:hypothetical protein
VEEVMTANKALLSRLLARKEMDSYLKSLGEAILETVDSFKVYSVYCGNYPRAMKKLLELQLDSKFKTFLKKLSAGAEAKGLTLESFLVCRKILIGRF